MKCEACNGTGKRYSNSVKNSLNPLYPDGIIRCEYCNGTGEKPESQEPIIFDTSLRAETCPRCSYEGHKVKDSEYYLCTKCGNSWSYKIVIQPDPPEDNPEERIREAFEKEYDIPDTVYYSSTYKKYVHKSLRPSQVADQANALYKSFKAGFKSRDEEVEGLKAQIDDFDRFECPYCGEEYDSSEEPCCPFCDEEER